LKIKKRVESGFENIKKIESGYNHIVALDNFGRVFSMGEDTRGIF
jgi:hypothetical protein